MTITTRSDYFLTDLLDAPVYWHGKKIGKLADLAILDREGAHPAVTHIKATRPFGDAPLIVPLELTEGIGTGAITISGDALAAYEHELPAEAVLLKDHILDKKILDVEDSEVEVAYDIRLTRLQQGLFVTEVDISRYGLLRRMGLARLANMFYTPEARVNGAISWKYVQMLPESISSFKGNLKLTVLKERLRDIDPVDLADIIEELDPRQRAAVFDELDTAHASDTLEEIDPNVQRELVASLKKERVVQLINEMTPAQAADVLSALPADQVDDIMPLLNTAIRDKITSILEHQEAFITDFVTPDFIHFAPSTTVGEVEEEYPKIAKDKDLIDYIYVTEGNILKGIVDLHTLLLADDAAPLQKIMDTHVIALGEKDSLKEAHKIFKRYGFKALPITNDAGAILGIVLSRDILDLHHRSLE